MPGRGAAATVSTNAETAHAMTAASQSQLVTLRSGDVVRIRQVRPDDAPALVRAYANLGEQSRYRRFFTVMPELPEATLKAAVEVDHIDHEALVAVPLLSTEIVGECRFIRLPDQLDTAEVGVTVVASALVPVREAADPMLRGEHQIARARSGGPPASHRDPLQPPGGDLGQVRVAPGLQVHRQLRVAGPARAEHIVEATVIKGLIQIVPEGSELAEVDDKARAGQCAGGKGDLHHEAAAIRYAVPGAGGLEPELLPDPVETAHRTTCLGANWPHAAGAAGAASGRAARRWPLGPGSFAARAAPGIRSTLLSPPQH